MRRAPYLQTLSEGIDPQAIFVRMPSVVRMTGLGRSTIYRLVAERKFPVL